MCFCMHSSLTLNGLNRHLPFILLIFNILEHMCIRYFCIHYNPPLTTVQLLVLEVLIFQESIELLPPGDSPNLYPVNYDSTEGMKIALVGISYRNKLG